VSEPREEARVKAHAIHDFTAKLRQPGLAGQLSKYIAWRRRLSQARADGEPEPPPPPLAPLSINLDLTTACNYRCTHCIDWDILNTKHKYKEQELRDSLCLMAERGLKSVILIGGGEPTLYPRFPDFVAFLKELELQVAIVSNGSRGDVLADAAAHMDERDWIRLSLDSGSNELFVEMHRPTSRAVDLDSICASIPKIKERNPAVRVGFSYIIVWGGASRDDEKLCENIDEIVMATERAKRSGFDYIGFKPVLERRPDGAEVMDPEKTEAELDRVIARIRAEVDRAKEFADDDFDVYESINLRLLEDGSWQQFTNQPQTCHMQALRQVLTPTGLYNCPAHRGVEKAKIGGPTAYRDAQNAGETGDGLKLILDRFDASKECREVTCLYNSVNWWLEKLIADPELASEAELGDERFDYFL
jgi:wyosine [tRNA(Phe)-imidazoG37] synthetase (radical SAM superfamily)